MIDKQEAKAELLEIVLFVGAICNKFGLEEMGTTKKTMQNLSNLAEYIENTK